MDIGLSSFNLSDMRSMSGMSLTPNSGLSGLNDLRTSSREPLPDFTQMLERAVAADRQTSAPAEVKQQETPVFSSGRAVIDKDSQLFEACRELETFLIKTLISSMRDTVQKSNLIDTGLAGQFYEDMLYDEYAKDMAGSAGWGFAEMAYLELTGQRGKTISNRPDFVAARYS